MARLGPHHQVPTPVETTTTDRGSDLAWYETGENRTTTQLLSGRDWSSANPFTYAGLLARLELIAGNNMPRMRVIPASRIEGLGYIPRSTEGHAVDAIEAVRRCGPDADQKPKAVLVMFSHRWLQPRWPDPEKLADPDSKDHVKAKAIVQWAKWFKWWRLFGSGREFVKGITVDPDLEVFFWIDFCCVDQDAPGPEMAALPAYVSACAEMLVFATQGYDLRAWCQVELMMGYAFMAVGDKIFQIPPGFTHKRQRTVTFSRYRVPDPSKGALTNEDDRKVIIDLREAASASTAFTFPRSCRNLFCSDPVSAALWACCCCGWLGFAAWLNSRSSRPGHSVVYRLTPKDKVADAEAQPLLIANAPGGKTAPRAAPQREAGASVDVRAA